MEEETVAGCTKVAMNWGSDAVAQVLRNLDIPYAALVPGASYRGLHDSIVNYLGNKKPEMLLCLHEEHSVAIAMGYAKVTGSPMVAIVHSNVGLMHATMAIFNAWCDRVPVLVIGANGPVDAAKRRPWIDWIHTAQDLGALVRGYTKWDDQPGSPAAAVESVLRAWQIATTPPFGPTLVVLDAAIQEEKLQQPRMIPPVVKFVAPQQTVPARGDVEQILALLRGAKHPVILAGRCNRTIKGWDERVALAEAVNARVITQGKVGSVAFPSDHVLHIGPTGSPNASAALREADLILDLDSVDLAGVLASIDGSGSTTVISASVDRYIHNGWSMDHQALPAVDISIASTPDALVSELVQALGCPKPRGAVAYALAPRRLAEGPSDSAIGIDAFSLEVSAALADVEVTYSRLPLGIDSRDFVFRHPLDFLGGEGGGGVGAGCGAAVGAALALRDSSRIVACLIGDGDYLMGGTALWTAVQHEIPVLVVVANNRSYFNDEVHQERMAVVRGRPVERKWIGQRISDPPPDLASFARSLGAHGIGPIEQRGDIGPAIAAALQHVRAGKVCVVDVVVRPEYAGEVAAGIVDSGASRTP